VCSPKALGLCTACASYSAFGELVASIKEEGLREPIVILDDAILDGRNRYNACLAAGVDPVFRPFTGDDPVRFVLAANVHRRHLTDSQRSMLAAKLATLGLGSNQHHNEGASREAPSQAKAAELLGVSRSSVQRAREVLERAEPADIKAITEGKATVGGVAKTLRGTSKASVSEIAPARASKAAQQIEQDDVAAALVLRLKLAAVTAGECVELLNAHRAAVDDAILIAAEAAAGAWKMVSRCASTISIANRSEMQPRRNH
jgi:ParB-like chromosome segregation protein Spo0J